MMKTQDNMGSHFYHLGNNVIFEDGVEISRPQEVSLGDLTYVQRDCFFNIPIRRETDHPKIEVWENCGIGKRCVISAVNRIVIQDRVLIGANVHITDHDHEYREVGIPVMFQGVTTTQAEVVIGRGSWIANNCVIVGNVHIGRGCVIGANSVVNRDIPDYCVAVGAPARVVKCFDWINGKWLKINRKIQLTQLLEARKTHKPLFTVAVLVGDDPEILDASLDSICREIGNDSIFEILVCSNEQGISFQEITQRYVKEYKNVRPAGKKESTNFDLAYLEAVERASGEYVTVVNDSEPFAKNLFYHIVNALYQNPNCAVLFLQNANQIFTTKPGKGWDDYTRDTLQQPYRSSLATLHVGEVNRLTDKERFAGSGLNHVYLQHQLLSRNRNYSISSGIVFVQDENSLQQSEENKKLEGRYQALLRNLKPSA